MLFIDALSKGIFKENRKQILKERKLNNDPRFKTNLLLGTSFGNNTNNWLPFL